jgi:ABC-type uncharacterized transport system substrate-binding protein
VTFLSSLQGVGSPNTQSDEHAAHASNRTSASYFTVVRMRKSSCEATLSGGKRICGGQSETDARDPKATVCHRNLTHCERITRSLRRRGRITLVKIQAQSSGTSQFAVIQAMAPLLGIEVVPINMLDAEGIERAVGNFAQAPKGSLIVTGGGASERYRNLIVTLAAKWKVPAIYFERSFTAIGGLMSYGAHQIELFRQSAGYVDRILKGEKPGDLPVQAPTKYELVINRKTAKLLGLEVPASLLATADEVIE